jgi:hypothetical protein
MISLARTAVGAADVPLARRMDTVELWVSEYIVETNP